MFIFLIELYILSKLIILICNKICKNFELLNVILATILKTGTFDNPLKIKHFLFTDN